MRPKGLDEALRALAKELETLDVEVYREYGRDPLAPILGEGPENARLGIFGRDPGRYEVQQGAPFVGAGGKKIRQGLAEAFGSTPPPEVAVDAGEHVFWANTVPYKPVGNKVWPAKVRRAFQPLISDLLIHGWQGRDLLVMGRVALFWFGQDPTARQAIKAHWSREDRFETSLEVTIHDSQGTQCLFRLHPLPHPSPLNAVWAPRFPGLLASRLKALEFGAQSWAI